MSIIKTHAFLKNCNISKSANKMQRVNPALDFKTFVMIALNAIQCFPTWCCQHMLGVVVFQKMESHRLGNFALYIASLTFIHAQVLSSIPQGHASLTPLNNEWLAVLNTFIIYNCVQVIIAVKAFITYNSRCPA